ncbi:ABC transporter substrate-binding protein [Trinickia sp. YCB016]
MKFFPIHLLNFEGAFNLPLWVANDLGIFEKHGLVVTTEYTKGSVDMVERLAEGAAQIALTSVDNVIAYASGHGETANRASLDLIAFMGGDRGFLSLVARPEIASIATLRGKNVSVDAITTGFAYAFRSVLTAHHVDAGGVNFVAAGGTGNRYRELMAGAHDATLVRSPFDVLARRQGFNVLANVSELFPSYLGTVGAARRSWVEENRTQTIAFILAYREALKWIWNNDNQEAAIEILKNRFPELSEPDATVVYESLVDGRSGLLFDMEIPEDGVNQVAAIRSAHSKAKNIASLQEYVDLQYLCEARRSALW